MALDFPGYARFPSVDGEIRPKANIIFDQLKEEGLIRTDGAGGPFFNLTEKGLLEGNTTWLKRQFERLNDKQGIWAFLSFLVSLIALFSKR